MKIFLSHASDNKEIVRQFQLYLPKHVHIWLDENELGLGERFPASLEKAIMEECDFVVVFISNESEGSEWVEQEIKWALAREKELERTFIIPILLHDIWKKTSLPGMNERLYLSCLDHSSEALKDSVHQLSQYLFAFVSRYFGKTKITPASHFLHDMKEDLTTYKELSYMLHATLGDSIEVLSTNEDAFNQFAKAVENYNLFTTTFIQELPDLPNKVRKYWGNNLADESSELVDYIENEAYRGHVFALNNVREAIITCTDAEKRKEQDISQLDEEKDIILDKMDQTLSDITRRSTQFLSKVEKEI